MNLWDIKRYFKNIPSKADLQLDLIEYWISVQQYYSFLFLVACDIYQLRHVVLLWKEYFRLVVKQQKGSVID